MGRWCDEDQQTIPGESAGPPQQAPSEISNHDISGQSYGERDDRLRVRDDLGMTRPARTGGTYSVITTGDRTAAEAARGGGGVNARGGATGGGATGGGVNTGNTGATGGANTGVNTGGMNTGGTGGGLNAGTNTGGTGGGIRGTAGDAGTRLDNPDSFGTGTKYPDDSL